MPSMRKVPFLVRGFLSETTAAWLVAVSSAVIGLVLTALIATVTQGSNQRELQQRFESAANKRAAAIQASFDGYMRDLDGVRRFFINADEISRAEFRGYSEPLLNHTLAFSWIPRVTALERPAFEQRVRAEGFQAFVIRDLNNEGQLVGSAGRLEHFPVLYAVSRRVKQLALGFDLASHAARLKTLDKARLDGFMAASEVLQLIGTSPEDSRGVLLVAPVYPTQQVPADPALRRSQLRGFVLAAVSLHQMLEEGGSGERADTLELELLDASNESSPPLVYRSAQLAAHPLLHFSRDVQLADRTYRLTIYPTDAFLAANRLPGLAITVSAGILLSAMLATLLFSLVSQRQRAQTLVETRTAELRAREQQLAVSEQRWSFALDGAGDGVWDWDVSSNRVFFSPAWKRMLGYHEDDIGDALDEWNSRIHPCDKDACAADLQGHLSGALEFYRNEHRLRCQDGSWKWILGRGKVVERAADGQPLRVIGTHTDISWRKAAELELARVNGQLHGLLNAATQVSIIATDLNGLILTFNAGAERMLGYRADEMIGLRTPEYIHRRDELDARQLELSRRYGRPVVGFAALVAEAVEGDSHEEREWTYVRRDGSELTVNLIITGVRDEQNALIGFLGIAIDITERKRIHEVLAARDRLLEKLTARVPGAIYQYQLNPDGSSCFPYASAGMLDIYEVDPLQLREDAAAALKRIHPDDLERIGLSIQQSGAQLSVWREEYRALLPQRGLRWMRGEAVPERMADGAVLWHGYLTDITGPKLVEHELRELSITDALTGIYNRRYFQERLEVEITRVRRNQSELALIMLDLDHFKQVNDRFGHEAGDRVLTVTCQRLSQRLRRADVFCRLGGEEFIILCPDTSAEQAQLLAEALQQALRREPVEGVGNVTASFGVAAWRLGETSDDLLRRVDAGVYLAKQNGRDQVRSAVL